MENNQPNVRQAVPFFMVADMETSLDFYTKGLGFELMNTWVPRGKIEWCWLRLGEASLMLQEHRKNDGRYEPENKKGLGVCICFQCSDAIALYHEFTAKGVTTKEPFVGNNLWVTHLTDPDGYQMEFSSETDVPEETTYAEWVSGQ
jgi:catechol 2,3-dioxygenase-like lactoylglutathione lyase family enzyme